MEAIWDALAIGEAGDLGGFVSIQGGNKAIWEPKVRPWQVTAKSSQVKVKFKGLMWLDYDITCG